MSSTAYRNDIDGLRAIAVIAVILFHFGLAPHGYLGVDVFFVISGYLITGIIYKEASQGTFSILRFYLRRTRRIIPLVTAVSIIALVAGMLFMLPDDLENLAQSVVATSIFGNNVLQVVTTKNYWDVVNEYKPLMHTWSLGVEEQYYMLYPFLFVLLAKARAKWVLPALAVLSALSIAACFSPAADYLKFYLLPFRFFELAVGGMAAIALGAKLLPPKASVPLLALLLAALSFGLGMPAFMLLVVVVAITCVLLASEHTRPSFSAALLGNPVVVYIGKLSFSLYMWHQVILAFSRYFLCEDLAPAQLVWLAVATVAASAITYHFVEGPFRDGARVSTRNLLVVLGVSLLAINAGALYIYVKRGVIKDVPELDIRVADAKRGKHSEYNHAVFQLDRGFENAEGLKVLVVGNSFARDWVNVLLESKYSDRLVISYTPTLTGDPNLHARATEADVIFVSEAERETIAQMNLEPQKVWCVGTKNFGKSSGYYYNYRGENYYGQRARIDESVVEFNQRLGSRWGDRYVDLLGLVMDDRKTVPVFTPDRKFISQDCRHLTRAGAVFFARLVERDPAFVFNRVLGLPSERAGAGLRPDTHPSSTPSMRNARLVRS